jgi:hypothetical protein
MLWTYAKKKTEMTTLLQEFEEWLSSYCGDDEEPWYVLLSQAERKLEELKKKHGMPNVTMFCDEYCLDKYVKEQIELYLNCRMEIREK